MKKIILGFLLGLIPSLIFGQICSVDSIGINDCEINIVEHVIPVFVSYKGKADSVKIEVVGLDYSFEPQYFRMFQHFINPSNQNTFHFPIYNSDRTTDSIDIKVSLIGNECNMASHYLMKNFILDDQSCFCTESFVLSGIFNEDRDYYVSTFINTSQEILTGNQVLYSAKTYVDWENGFTVENGAILDINFIGCDIIE